MVSLPTHKIGEKGLCDTVQRVPGMIRYGVILAESSKNVEEQIQVQR